ncbi:Class I peptide chain release factor [Desulfonatronospira thiodismutans ASO3-1]|uniref:Class I peptide chain release factor n=1 Tax=Desulfonatronospira thiodismutans ASO3-1 TaxID=555779 RepID=D6SKA9_9BACT|nr:alternative ribosome rescue aminoacyl-tRNA hydrolase ArfB [Desulfonatronospira thiodismutans]EFI36312.1 Class I peptide chain release factor [Desulfonatronospira thiodismutans ASO3-1]
MKITENLSIKESEIDLQAVRASGPGGQKVNKTASAVQLFFDIKASSLPQIYKERLLNLNDQRITRDGVIVIRAERSRSQAKNKKEALKKLQLLIQQATVEPEPRKPTRPSRSAKQRRLAEKARRSRIKEMRKPVHQE